MDLEKIANLIKTKRKEKNLTQAQLAEQIHVTEKAVSRWETSRGTPDISLLLPLSKALGISVSEILSGKEDKKADENIKDIMNYLDSRKKRFNTKYLILSICIYFITLFCYLAYLKNIYSGFFAYDDYKEEMSVTIICSICILIANALISHNYCDKIEDKEKMKKVSYILLLILYLIMIFNLTILGRSNGEIRYNLIPLNTIKEYLLQHHKFNTDIIIVNIFGNFAIFMPVQYLILKIFNLKKFKFVFIIDIILIFIVEFLQFITHTGIFDIDDILLNLSGMLFLYSWLQIKQKRKTTV